MHLAPKKKLSVLCRWGRRAARARPFALSLGPAGPPLVCVAAAAPLFRSCCAVGRINARAVEASQAQTNATKPTRIRKKNTPRNFQDISRYTGGFRPPMAAGQPDTFTVVRRMLPGPVGLC